jgi:hypothetical protein
VERQQQRGEVEEHQHPVVEEAGERQRQRQVLAAVGVEELADRCSLGGPAVLAVLAAEVGQC